MIILNEMDSQQLTYLKQKMSAEVIELDRDIIRTQDRLTTRLAKQEIDQVEIDGLKDDLLNAEQLMSHLTTTSAPQQMIDKQQSMIDKTKSKLDSETKGRNVLTDEEAYLQQVNIDELKLQKQYREEKIVEIGTLLAP
ncbi:hypothetical protein [Reichenbachiella versicolor]|uniref:hypothetical protein n=1 Tax=Reichenbachiella versicolor TaxID=1821036 RepID=UPI000D6DDE67|nr:hypothetical protein [Reichenbachiella versicolor]